MGQTLVSGLANGGIYALLAVGIVLVYKGSRVLNFAQGEIGTFGLFLTWWMTDQQHLPWIAGAGAAMAAGAIIGVGFERLVVRPMGEASRWQRSGCCCCSPPSNSRCGDPARTSFVRPSPASGRRSSATT